MKPDMFYIKGRFPSMSHEGLNEIEREIQQLKEALNHYKISYSDAIENKSEWQGKYWKERRDVEQYRFDRNAAIAVAVVGWAGCVAAWIAYAVAHCG